MDAGHGPIRDFIVLGLEPSKQERQCHPKGFLELAELNQKPGADEAELEGADEDDSFEMDILKKEELQADA